MEMLKQQLLRENGFQKRKLNGELCWLYEDPLRSLSMWVRDEEVPATPEAPSGFEVGVKRGTAEAKRTVGWDSVIELMAKAVLG